MASGPFVCPQCGRQVKLLLGRYCGHCCHWIQSKLEQSTREYECWERLSPARHDRRMPVETNNTEPWQLISIRGEDGSVRYLG